MKQNKFIILGNTNQDKQRMFLAVNIIIILLVVRLSLNAEIIKAFMGYQWRMLLHIQQLLYFSVFIFVTILSGKDFLFPKNLPYYVLFMLSINLGIYYLVFSKLVPHYYLANKYPTFILYALLIFLLSSLLIILSAPVLFDILFKQAADLHLFLYHIYTQQGFVILVASFLGISKDKFLFEKKFQSLEEAKDQVELDFLKSKLSPHFLLNTLNNIYVKSLVRSNSSAASILQLTKLLQYVIYDVEAEKISLAKELSTMRNLHQLYQLKFEQQLAIKFHIEQEETLELIEIPPAICLTLFENALKHSAIGVVKNSYVHVYYKYTGGVLHLEIRNSISEKQLTVQTGYTGLGKKTVNHILQKHYGSRFSLVSQIGKKNSYHTILKITI